MCCECSCDNSQNDNKCCHMKESHYAFITLILIFMGILTGLGYGIADSAIEMKKYWSYSEHSCNITNISYPIERYSDNYTDHWNNCVCGDRESKINGVRGCIKLFASIDESEYIFPVYGLNDGCSIKTLCGCNDIGINQAFLDAQNYYDDYYENNVKCYYNDAVDNIYLKLRQPTELATMILYAIFLMVLLAVVIVFLYIMILTYINVRRCLSLI